MKRIGILIPSLFCEKKYFSDIIFAPGELAVELSNALLSLGHEVVCYSTPGFETQAKVSSVDLVVIDEAFNQKKCSAQKFIKDFPEHFKNLQHYYELALTQRAIDDFIAGKIDVIHVMHGFSSLFMLTAAGINTVVATVHDPVVNTIIRYPRWAYEFNSTVKYISISESQKENASSISFFDTVYNGVDVEKFLLQKKKDDYIAFVGRILEVKGVHIAIEAAKKAGVKLKIAGNIFGKYGQSAYFKKYINPELGDTVEYVGHLKDDERISFLQNARALLFPIQWEEPFGLVMAEAMACGTPVIAFNRGSVSEVVKDGQTGYIVNTVHEMVDAMQKIKNIDPEVCRKWTEDMFSVTSMAEKYSQIYQKI